MAFQSKSKSKNVNSFLKSPGTQNQTNIFRPVRGDVDFNQYIEQNSQGRTLPTSMDFNQFRNNYKVEFDQNNNIRTQNDNYWTQNMNQQLPTTSRMVQQNQNRVAKRSTQQRQRKPRRRKQTKSGFTQDIKNIANEIFNKKKRKVSLFEHIYDTCTKENRSQSVGIVFIIILLVTFVILLFVYNMKKNQRQDNLMGGLSKRNPFQKYF